MFNINAPDCAYWWPTVQSIRLAWGRRDLSNETIELKSIFSIKPGMTYFMLFI